MVAVVVEIVTGIINTRQKQKRVNRTAWAS